MILFLSQFIYLLTRNREIGALRRVMVRAFSQGLKGWSASLLNLIWDQLGFTKRQEDLKLINKNLSAYQKH